MSHSVPRLRFAPSPTGYLHVGGARTALFNWLYARRHGGVFVLRIEDTDVERSSDEMVTGILESMRWLGLDWDEGPGIGGPHGPYFQSQRLARYRELAEQLVSTGAAYYCYCDPDEIKAKRDAAQARGEVWEYDRTCRSLASDEVARREAAGRRRAIRFKTPDGATAFADIVQGRIEFDHAHLEDFVVLRSDGHPTYHLSVVADDVDMRITHVVRGADHISNTPKQVLLYEALGAPVPEFAHVPLILGPDKRRLSKRHGATSVGEYERQGYVPEAMVNFLALLGWSPGDDRELFSREELVGVFGLDGINTSNAVFNPEKLDWFNAMHIARLSTPELIGRLEPAFRAAGLWRDAFAGDEQEWFGRVTDLLRPRCRRLTEYPEAARYFIEDPAEYDGPAARKHFASPEVPALLTALAGALAVLPSFTPEPLEACVRGLAEAGGSKPAALIHATRLALTGRSASPGLFEVMELLGRDRTVARLRAAAKRVGESIL
jgi:glutamyl-tRNA synthetase